MVRRFGNANSNDSEQTTVFLINMTFDRVKISLITQQVPFSLMKMQSQQISPPFINMTASTDPKLSSYHLSLNTNHYLLSKEKKEQGKLTH